MQSRTVHADSDISLSPSKPKASTRSKNSSQTRTQRPAADAQDTIDKDSEFLDALGQGKSRSYTEPPKLTDQDGALLTESLFTTHRLCRTPVVDEPTLCSSLVQTSSALGKVIRLVADKHEQLSRQGRNTPGAASLDLDKSDFSVALSVCARAFMSILVGASKLIDAGSDKRLPSLVLCELADVFKTALDSIEASAGRTANAAISQSTQSKKGKSKAPNHHIKESVPARAVAHLLIGFLSLLDKTDVFHQKLFDGFAFVLFERAGKRLYYCTFGRHRSTTVEGDILAVPKPQTPVDTAKHESAALAVRLEVKALVLILERAMGLAPNHMNPPTARASRPATRTGRTLSIRTLPSVSRARLSPIAKERLQRTLVACMYGNSADDEFLDVLTKPVPAVRLGSLPNVAKVEENVEQWYQQEVWRLVGWDVLARERE